MKKLSLLYTLLFSFALFSCNENNSCEIPAKPNPQRLVNDYAKVFSESEVAQLENTLENYSVKTSTDIAIVTVNDLCDYDKSDFAFKIIDNWGIGQKGKDNGLLFLLKPKETAVDGKGDMFIATGRGLEGAIPDAIAKRIVEDEMIPYFKQNEHYAGIVNGLNHCMQLASQDFEPTTEVASPGRRKRSTDWLIPLIVFVVIFGFIFFSNSQQVSQYARKNHIPWWTAWWIIGSRGGRGTWFGGGSGGFGGGGGFGGFGGGSSGGGGAGGSW